MPASLEPSVTKNCRLAVSNTPVEIWQEIIDKVLWDPAIFSCDPFYHGCNLHSALKHWHDKGRARTHEIQRNTLRLVSRSWKALADASHWQYFDPYVCLDEAQRLVQSRSARRIQIQPSCPSCRCHRNEVHACIECRNIMDDINWMVFSKLPPKIISPKTIILGLPQWEGALIHEKDFLADGFPLSHLRALVVCVDVDAATGLLRLLPNLTFLSIHIPTYPGDHPSDTPVLPNLKTLQLIVYLETEGASIERWDLPRLAHLEITSTYMDKSVSHIFAFLKKLGPHLVSLRLRIEHGWVYLPQDMWEEMPLLEYLGTTAIWDGDGPHSLPSCAPPHHSLHTIAILEEEEHGVRSRTALFTNSWKNITTIADCHCWEDMPESFQYHRFTHSESFEHYHNGEPCMICVGTLYVICNNRRLRYEDCTGKTYEEFRN